jgi:two-component system response regulator FixJ
VKPVIHVIDDDDAARESLSFLLETAGLSVRSYESALDFLAAFPEREPGCIVVDVRMPEMSGIELLEQLRKAGSGMPVIVITGHADVPLAVEAMKLGAIDFLEKPFEEEIILRSIQAALDRPAGGATDAEAAAVQARLALLSTRERQVLEGLVIGNPNKVIAYDLGISPRTVEVYRANVMTKMMAGSLSDLVRMALLAGDVIRRPARPG